MVWQSADVLQPSHLRFLYHSCKQVKFLLLSFTASLDHRRIVGVLTLLLFKIVYTHSLQARCRMFQPVRRKRHNTGYTTCVFQQILCLANQYACNFIPNLISVKSAPG